MMIEDEMSSKDSKSISPTSHPQASKPPSLTLGVTTLVFSSTEHPDVERVVAGVE